MPKGKGSQGVRGEGKRKLKASLPLETCLLRLCGNLSSQQSVQEFSKCFPSHSKLTRSCYAYLIQLQTLSCSPLKSGGLAVNAALNKTSDPTYLLLLHCCLLPSLNSHFSWEMNAHLQAEWNPHGLYLKL